MHLVLQCLIGMIVPLVYVLSFCNPIDENLVSIIQERPSRHLLLFILSARLDKNAGAASVLVGSSCRP